MTNMTKQIKRIEKIINRRKLQCKLIVVNQSFYFSKVSEVDLTSFTDYDLSSKSASCLIETWNMRRDKKTTYTYMFTYVHNLATLVHV